MKEIVIKDTVEHRFWVDDEVGEEFLKNSSLLEDTKEGQRLDTNEIQFLRDNNKETRFSDYDELQDYILTKYEDCDPSEVS